MPCKRRETGPLAMGGRHFVRFRMSSNTSTRASPRLGRLRNCVGLSHRLKSARKRFSNYKQQLSRWKGKVHALGGFSIQSITVIESPFKSIARIVNSSTQKPATSRSPADFRLRSGASTSAATIRSCGTEEETTSAAPYHGYSLGRSGEALHRAITAAMDAPAEYL